MSFVHATLVPGLPHPLLCPDAAPGYRALADGFAAAGEALRASKPDLLVLYSTMWPSVLGHQVQARPRPRWVHVDELFHALGSIPYELNIDADFAHALVTGMAARGLHARPVDYEGFPIDTGSVVALKMLDPSGSIPAVILSSNVYADRAETVVLGEAVTEAVGRAGRRAAAVAVSTLSNRLFTDWVAPEADRVHSAKDDEWNRKILELWGQGRLEDLAQLSRNIHSQVRVKKVVSFKPFWWLSAVMGAHNRYDGQVHAYGGLHGTGAAVCSLSPRASAVGEREFDEDSPGVWRGDREVLDPAAPSAPAPEPAAPVAPAAPPVGAVHAAAAPRPVGAYPHARRVGELLFVSGMGPRDPATNAVPGGPVRDAAGQPLPYDVRAQTRAVIANLARVLEAAGSRLDKVVDVQVFLIDMDRDFAAFNEVYNELLGPIGPTRTTVAVSALPTPIAVELKVIALP